MSEGRRAILIGNAVYPADEKLTDLTCPLNDVDDLAGALADPARGGFEPVLKLHDKTNEEVRRKLEEFIGEAHQNDTVLFYYSGHGKLDASHRNLFLCAKDTQVKLLKSTALSFGFVDDLLRDCEATRTVVLLDCCYSGAAMGLWPKGDLETLLNHAVQEGSGSYLLTASDAIGSAQEKEGDRNGVFTKHVIRGLTDGTADREGRGIITMDDLYRHVVRAVPADSKQRPNRQVGGHGEIVIAKSGRDSRKERADNATRLLYSWVAEGQLDPSVALAVDAIANKALRDLSEQESSIDTGLDDLLSGKKKLGLFVTAYWQAQLSGGSGSKIDPRHTTRGSAAPIRPDQNLEYVFDRKPEHGAMPNQPQPATVVSEPFLGGILIPLLVLVVAIACAAFLIYTSAPPINDDAAIIATIMFLLTIVLIVNLLLFGRSLDRNKRYLAFAALGATLLATIVLHWKRRMDSRFRSA